jgi:hypothetical protein
MLNLSDGINKMEPVILIPECPMELRGQEANHAQ